MNDLEKIIIEEISTLEDMRLIDVIGFIRYLKAENPFDRNGSQAGTRAPSNRFTNGKRS